jgi:HEAT repeat protein
MKTVVTAVVSILFAVSHHVIAEDEPTVGGKPMSEQLKQLTSENRGFQMRAARALSEVPAESRAAIVPKLMPLLKSERENDRFVAAQVLGEYGPVAKAAVPELMPLLGGTQYERNRAAAAKALGQILKDAQPSEEVDKVAEALAKKFNEDYDKYSDVRREAACAIGMIGPAAKKILPKLAGALNDFQEHSQEHFMVRAAGAYAIGRMGADAASYMDKLISMMHSEIDVATTIVWAIGEIGPVNDNVPANVMNRIEKVMAGGGFRVGPFVYRVAEMNEGTVQEYMDYCFKTLEKFGPKSVKAVPLMNRCISEDGWQEAHRIRNAVGACRVLRAVGPAAKEALPALEKVLQVTRYDGRIPKETVELLKKEAQCAIDAIKGSASADAVKSWK